VTAALEVGSAAKQGNPSAHRWPRSNPVGTSTAGPDDAKITSSTAPTIPLDFPTLDELAVEILDARERR